MIPDDVLFDDLAADGSSLVRLGSPDRPPCHPPSLGLHGVALGAWDNLSLLVPADQWWQDRSATREAVSDWLDSHATVLDTWCDGIGVREQSGWVTLSPVVIWELDRAFAWLDAEDETTMDAIWPAQEPKGVFHIPTRTYHPNPTT